MKYLSLTFIFVLWATLVQAQQVYLSPIDGTGTDSDPFKSRCFGMPGAGNIDIRPTETTSNGYMICSSNTLPANQTGIIILGSSLTGSITAKTKSDVLAAVGISVKGGTVDEVIKEVFIPKVSGVQKSGFYDIYLGQKTPSIRVPATLSNDIRYKGFVVAMAEREYRLVTDTLTVASKIVEPAIALATTLATETFTGSNGSISGNTYVLPWVTWSGTWSIVGGTQAQGSVTGSEARADSTLATSDTEAQVTVVSQTGGGAGFTRCGPIVRVNNSGTRTFYWGLADGDTTDAAYTIAKRVASTYTSLTTNLSANPVANDVVKIRVTSVSTATLELFVNGVSTVGPQTDASIASNTYTGISFTSSLTSPLCTVDNFSAADYSATTRRPLAPIIIF